MPDPILDALLSQPVSERPFDPADEGYASDLSGYVKEGIAETVGKLKFVPKFEQKSIIESGPVGAGAKVGVNALAGAANFILGIPEFLLGAGTDVAIGGLHYGAAATKQVMMDPVEESKYMEELKKKGLGEDYIVSKAKEYGQGLLGAWRTDISADERVKMIEEDPISAIMPLLVAAGTAKSAGLMKGKESVRTPGTPGEKLTIIAESENSPAWERVQAKKALAEQVDQSLINRLTKFYDKNQEKLYKLEEPGEQGRVAPVAEIPIDDPQALIAAREKIASQIASVQQPILKAVLEQTDKALEEKINEIQKAPESPAPAAGLSEAPSALPVVRPPSEAVPAATSIPTPNLYETFTKLEAEETKAFADLNKYKDKKLDELREKYGSDKSKMDEEWKKLFDNDETLKSLIAKSGESIGKRSAAYKAMLASAESQELTNKMSPKEALKLVQGAINAGLKSKTAYQDAPAPKKVLDALETLRKVDYTTFDFKSLSAYRNKLISLTIYGKQGEVGLKFKGYEDRVNNYWAKEKARVTQELLDKNYEIGSKPEPGVKYLKIEQDSDKIYVTGEPSNLETLKTGTPIEINLDRMVEPGKPISKSLRGGTWFTAEGINGFEDYSRQEGVGGNTHIVVKGVKFKNPLVIVNETVMDDIGLSKEGEFFPQQLTAKAMGITKEQVAAEASKKKYYDPNFGVQDEYAAVESLISKKLVEKGYDAWVSVRPNGQTGLEAEIFVPGLVEKAKEVARGQREEISQTAKVRELDAKSEQSFVDGIKEGHKAVREKYLGDHNQQKAISLFKNRWLKDHGMDLTPAEKQVYDPLVAITVDHLKTGDIAAAITEIDNYINTLSKFGKDMPIKRDYVEFAKKVKEMFKKRQDEERASTGELTKDITEKSKLKEIDEARDNKRKFDNIENAVTEQEHAAAEAAAIADEIFSAERNLEDMRKMNMEKPEVSIDKATREAGLSKVELAPEPVAEGGKFSANEQIAEAYQLYREAGLDAVKQLPNGWPGKAEIIAQAETGKVTKSFLNKVLKENAEKAAIARGPKPLGITAGSVLEAERAQKAQTEANLRDLTRPEVEKALSPDMLKLLDQEKGRPGQGSRLAKRLVNWFNSIMRSFRYGWDERAHPEFVEDMRLASGAYRRSIEKAMDAYADIAIHLKNPAEYEIFKQIVVGWDLLETAVRGEQLPFGMTKAEVAANLVKSNAAATPNVRRALEARTNLWQGVAQHLEARGKLRPGTARSDYFRHEVIRYSDGLTFAPEFGKSSTVRDPYRPYLKKRGGSEAPIRTDVAYVDIKTLTKIFLDDARESFLYDTLRKNNDRSKINSMGLPDQGYRIYHPKLGLRHTMTGMEEMIQRKIEESIANGDIVDTPGPELIGNMRIQLLNKGNWYVIPEALAHRLNNLMETGPRRDVIDAINSAHGKWKAVVLTAAGLPFQLVNLTGDLCNMYRENAQAFRQLGPAVREVWNAEIKKNPSDFYRALKDNEVVSSGYTLSELSDVFYDKRFSHLRDNSPLTMLAKSPSMVLAAIRHISEVRESIPRVAMAKELGTESGKKHLQKYHKADVEALGFERAGYKTSREFTVDYGRFTRFENRYLRGMLIPFYSWMAGNTYQWAKFHVTRPAEMLYKFYAPMYMTHVWNNTGPRKQIEEELQKSNPGIANSTHIITGLKDGNGKNIVLSLKLPIDDFLNVWRDPEGTIASGMTPIAKVPISLFAGKDVFTGAKIRPEDRTSYAIQNFVPLTRQAATEERKEAYGDPQGKFEKWAKSPIGLGALVQFYSDESLDMGSKWSDIRRRIELRDKLRSMATNKVWRLREEKDPGYLDNRMQPLVEEIQKDLEQRGMLTTFLLKMVPLSESSIPGAAVGTGQYVKEKFE